MSDSPHPPRVPQFLADSAGQSNQPTPARFAPLQNGQKPHLTLARPPDAPPAIKPAFQVPPTAAAPLPPPPPMAEAAPPLPGAPPPPVQLPLPPPPVAHRAPEAKPLDARIEAALEAFKLQAERLGEAARSEALEIGFMVARRILEQELTASPQPMFALVKSALRRAGEARKLSVHLSPADCARLRAAKAAESTLGLTLAQVELVEDPALGLGDCRVESELGSVDGRLSTRLEEISRAIEQAIAGDAA